MCVHECLYLCSALRIYMSIQIQETLPKHRTFEEICPTWARILATGIYDLKADMDTSYMCIVGEAWRWTDNYVEHCSTCNEFSQLFVYCVSEHQRIINKNELNKLKTQFTEHYNNTHI